MRLLIPEYLINVILRKKSINSLIKKKSNKIKQPLYSFKFDNKLFLQLIIFNKMSQHNQYCNPN